VHSPCKYLVHQLGKSLEFLEASPVSGRARHRQEEVHESTDIDRLRNSTGDVLVFQVMHFVDPSREVLAETLLAAGPDSPTLCKGWKTRDLAAHLYLRERKAAVGLGLIIKGLSRASGQGNRTAGRKAQDGRRLRQARELLPRGTARALAHEDQGVG
jgi:hypothetical protein